MIRKESGSYVPIQKWLKKNGYISKDNWTNRGKSKYRVDVIGIKNSGNSRYDDIEIVAVEAKMGGNYKSLGQAENYRDVAHKVYFATVTVNEDKVKKLKEGCIHKNLGLLQVNSRSKIVREHLSALVFKPQSEAETLNFLSKIKIYRCTLCQCYIDISGDKHMLKRLTQFNKMRIYRYLCKSCRNDLAKQSAFLSKLQDKKK